MNNKVLLFAVMTLLSSSAWSQTYNKVMHRNFWNDGKGVTGIRQDSVSVAYAEVYGNYISGALRSSSEASVAWAAGARTSAIRHLDKFSLAGSFSFEQVWSYGHAGSMFTRQGYFPIDIYEFTPGNKQRQTYKVDGGISVDVSPTLRLGAIADFTSANYSKTKDLRHTTYMLDFDFKPGIQYHLDDFAIAFNYVYSRSTETVKAEQVGSTVAEYQVFLDKGLFYGVMQEWNGSGVHLNEAGINSLPVSEDINGGSVQMSAGDFYASVQARARSGKAGEKQKVWCRFNGWDLDADLGYKIRSAVATHYLRGSFRYMSQTNNEYALVSKTEGGVTNTVTLGYNHLYTRSVQREALSYEYEGKRWTAFAEASFRHINGIATVMYPFKTDHTLLMPGVDLAGSCRLGQVLLRLAMGWTNGKIREEQTLVSENSGVQTEPMRLERYFVRYSEHLSANKIVVAPSVRYNFGPGLYVEAAYWWNHGFDMFYLGTDRNSATIKFGYNF